MAVPTATPFPPESEMKLTGFAAPAATRVWITAWLRDYLFILYVRSTSSVCSTRVTSSTASEGVGLSRIACAPCEPSGALHVSVAIRKQSFGTVNRIVLFFSTRFTSGCPHLVAVTCSYRSATPTISTSRPQLSRETVAVRPSGLTEVGPVEVQGHPVPLHLTLGFLNIYGGVVEMPTVVRDVHHFPS
jgi:hypothetical protein